MHQNPDILTRFLLDKSSVRGAFIELDSIWQQQALRQDFPQSIQQLVGESLALVALLSANIKLDGRISLQWQGQGPVGLLYAEYRTGGLLRATARFSEMTGSADQEDNKLLQDGILAVTLEPEQGPAYQGMVEVLQQDLGKSLEGYFRQSEQLETRIIVQKNRQKLSALMLQKMPDSDQRDPDGWNRSLMLAETLTESELLENTARDMLFKLFHEEGINILKEQPLSATCQCSMEKMQHIIRSMGETEAIESVGENGLLEAKCEFCGKEYHFDKIDISSIFQQNAESPDTPQ